MQAQIQASTLASQIIQKIYIFSCELHLRLAKVIKSERNFFSG